TRWRNAFYRRTGGYDADRSRSGMDREGRSVPVRLAQLAVRRLESKRARGADDCRRQDSLETLAAVAAADVAFQVRNRRTLAGDHMLDQITDRNDADDFAAFDHW